MDTPFQTLFWFVDLRVQLSAAMIFSVPIVSLELTQSFLFVLLEK